MNNPSTGLLSTDTVVTVSVSGGNATCGSTNYLCNVSLQSIHICLVLLLYDCVFCCFLSLAVGQDFTLSRTEVTFDQGANDGNFIIVSVDVLDDLLVEGTECFTLSGSIGSPAAPGSTFVGGPVTVCILDNEGK